MAGQAKKFTSQSVEKSLLWEGETWHGPSSNKYLATKNVGLQEL
jgi:hypothetical protein